MCDVSSSEVMTTRARTNVLFYGCPIQMFSGVFCSTRCDRMPAFYYANFCAKKQTFLHYMYHCFNSAGGKKASVSQFVFNIVLACSGLVWVNSNEA